MVRERGKSGSSSSTHYDDDHGSSSSSKSLPNRSKVFAKRTMTLKKKIFELTTLCDLDGCLIVKEPNGELKTWPENRDEVETVVQRYKNMNEEDRQKNNRDLSSFFIDEKKRLEIEIDKIRNENDSKTKSLYPTWDMKFDELSEDSLREMRCSLESKLENVKSRVKMKKQMMNREDDDHQIEINTATTTTSTTINPYFVKAENFAAMGGGDTFIPSSVPQTNLFPIRGTMSSMYNPGFGMMEDHLHLHQYYTDLKSDDGNYSTNYVSLPPLPPTAIFSHDQPQPLHACVPAAPSFQIEDHDRFFKNIYSHHQQQQQDFVFMPINGGDTY